MMVRYDRSEEVISLVLSAYVIGCMLSHTVNAINLCVNENFLDTDILNGYSDGAGPLLFSPLSEIPHIGRNPPYIVSFILFVAVSISLGFIDNFPAIVILRFLQGFLGSPCLATAGASIGDIYHPQTVPYGLLLWVACLYSGPALGPLFASHTVTYDWRWPFWLIAIMSASFLPFLICLLPETLPEKILIYRAQSLRKQNLSRNSYTLSELDHSLHWTTILYSVCKPAEITIMDPAIAFTCAYTAFIYAIYYSFFEVFPLVYSGEYQMTPKAFSLIFLAIVVGCATSGLLYTFYLLYYTDPDRSLDAAQESVLVPAIPGVIIAPAGLFLFAWTAQSNFFWLVPTIGIVAFCGGTFVVSQVLLTYIPRSYPRYAASLFAANDFVRSIVAAIFIMVTPYMYRNLGVSKGICILGSVSLLGIVGMGVLYRYGARMRESSRFTGQERLSLRGL